MFYKIISLALALFALLSSEVAPFIQKLNATEYDIAAMTQIYTLPEGPYTVIFSDSEKEIIEYEGQCFYVLR